MKLKKKPKLAIKKGPKKLSGLEWKRLTKKHVSWFH
jgi:hypothetical protein